VATPARVHYASGSRGRAAARGHGTVDGVNRDAGLHPLVDAVSDDPIRVDAFDRAQVDLAFAGMVFSDVVEPQLIRRLSCDFWLHQIIMVLGVYHCRADDCARRTERLVSTAATLAAPTHCEPS
jgi:hypothetical protein